MAQNEPCASNPEASSEAGRSALAGLRLDDDGGCSLCKDGVFRSFSLAGEVIDFRKLSPEHITTQLEKFAATLVYTDEELQRLRRILEGVDGRQVDDRECLNPDPEDRPRACIENKGGAESEAAKGRTSLT